MWIKHPKSFTAPIGHLSSLSSSVNFEHKAGTTTDAGENSRLDSKSFYRSWEVPPDLRYVFAYCSELGQMFFPPSCLRG